MGWFNSSHTSHHHHSPSRPSFVRPSSSSHSHTSRSSSYYKRRPRDGFVHRLIYKLKHLIRELLQFARRNPVKVFVFVVMPLISGGVLAAVARQFGIRLPAFLNGRGRGGGGNGRASGGGGYYGSHGYEKHGDSSGGGTASGLAGLGGLASGGNLASLMGVAKAFL